MNRLVLLLALVSFIFSGLSGCEKNNFSALQFSVKGKVVAKVNDFSIGLDDLNQDIEVYNTMVPAGSPELKISTRENKIDYLKNEMVRRTLLYQAALNRKLDKSQDFIDALQKAKLELLVLALVKQEVKKIEITSQEIEDHYNTYKDQLKSPEEINISEIVVPYESEAKDILVKLLKGEDFASLAKNLSKGKSADVNGSLGFISKEALFKEMADIVSTLPVGQVSGVFKGPEGYYIIKIEARRGGEQMTLDQARDDIKRGLTFIKQQQRIEEVIAKLARQSKIEVYEKEVK
jgi:parvulin-like peptidyl-prolyl isomerase